MAAAIIRTIWEVDEKRRKKSKTKNERGVVIPFFN
jgi:hypothetical protein